MQEDVIPVIVDLTDEVAACNALDHSVIDIYEGIMPFDPASPDPDVGAASIAVGCVGPTATKRFFMRFYTKVPGNVFTTWFPASIVSAR
jgi:hypothetical protein